MIDVTHKVSTLYNMINVPTGVWIDEDGRIVRPNEVAFSKNVAFGSIEVNGDDYADALRDWVARGEKSIYHMTPDEVTGRLGQRSSDEALADANSKLASYFHQKGNGALAEKYWVAAQRLNPESWNYHRQNWAFIPTEQRRRNWRDKFDALGERPYYAPLDLPQKKERRVAPPRQ